MEFDASSLLAALKAYPQNDGLAEPHLWNALSLLKQSLPEKAWIGFYRYEEKLGCLVLGPFQGTPACEKIALGKGVVGACYQKKGTVYVPDVSKFPGYICCDASAASELCLYLEEADAVLDIDYPLGASFEGQIPFYEEAAKILDRLFSCTRK